MTFLLSILAALRWLWARLARKPSSLQAADISGKLLCPCFATDADGDLVGLWGLLGMDTRHQDAVIASLRRYAARGETLMPVFLLTPSNLFARFPDKLNEPACAAAEAFCKRMLDKGVALGACLYNDDPSGSMPRWWEIEEHAAGWRPFFDRFGRYFSAVFLSIETNEKAKDRGQIEALLEILRSLAPGRQAYGTHLDWGDSRTPALLPRNADLLLFEGPWTIARGLEGLGDRHGVAGVENWIKGMRDKGVDLSKAVLHEFNMRPDGDIARAQRAAGRSAGLRGVGG